jgi:hypothetical protein
MWQQQQHRSNCACSVVPSRLAIVRLMYALYNAFTFVAPALAAVALSHADRRDDAALKSKVVVTGALVSASDIAAITVFIKLWRYCHQWQAKGAHVLLQVSPCNCYLQCGS